MPRPISVKPFTKSSAEWLQSYLATQEQWLPKSPNLLREIVQALLIRLQQKDPIGTRDLTVLIRDMTAREYHFEQFPQSYGQGDSLKRAAKYMDEAIAALAIGEISPRASHYPAVIRKQKDLLHWQLECLPPFPFKARQSALPMEWLRKYDQQLTQLLSLVLCQCTYPSSLAGEVDLTEAGDCRRPAQLITLLLAKLHRSKKTYIENLLKPSRTLRS